MFKISTLRWEAESSLVDREILNALVEEHGEHRADMIISDIAEMIAIRLNAVRKMITFNAFDAARFEARRIIELANMIGMVRLAEVVKMIEECTISGDSVSLTAIMARLERLEELSLSTIWGLDSDTN